MADPKAAQTAIRLSADLHARLVRISTELTKRSLGSEAGHGLPTVARMCVERGLPILENELGLTSKTKPTK